MIGVCMEQDPEVLRHLLLSALKQMSAYAKELNVIDNGTRKEYTTIEDWKKDASV